MTIIPAHKLAPHELAQLGHNIAAAVRADRQAHPQSNDDAQPNKADFDSDDQIEAATRSEHQVSP